VLSDIDIEQGAVSINNACVAGVDWDCTKTGEDRRIFLCPRALAILKSQLKLRAELEYAGRIQHDYVFFQHTGEPIRWLNGGGKPCCPPSSCAIESRTARATPP
jgi:integrase